LTMPLTRYSLMYLVSVRMMYSSNSKPFNITRFYTDDWGDYERHLEADKHEIGKRNTQKIDRKNLNFRTWIKRLTRKTLCFSKRESMHDTVIDLLHTRSNSGAIFIHNYRFNPLPPYFPISYLVEHGKPFIFSTV
jgi:hypothetical protein